MKRQFNNIECRRKWINNHALLKFLAFSSRRDILVMIQTK